MKPVRTFIAAVLTVLSAPALASPTWIVVGDSILCLVQDGQSKDMALTLVSTERDVLFKNLSAAGSALAPKDETGFNNEATLATIDLVGGAFEGYDGIMIQAGTNDYARSLDPAEMKRAAEAIIGKATENERKVLMLEPIWRAGEEKPNALGKTLDDYRVVLRETCQAHAGTCHFAPRGNTVLGSAASAIAFFSPTEIAMGLQTHPNVAGHRALADWIKAEAATAGFF